MGNLDGRTAIVTGAGRGIALKLASEGAWVVVNDLDSGPASETVLAVKTAGGDAVACPGGITEDGFAEHFVSTAVDTFGGLDIIVNNAGYTWDGIIQKTTDEQWDAILDVRLKAPFRILRAAQPYVRANPAAHHREAVNVSSIVGLSGNAGQINHASAKAGVVGLTRTLAKEWGRCSVNVNAVAFGLIRTRLTESSAAEGGAGIEVAGREIKVGISQGYFEAAERSIPLGRAGTPEEAAGAVCLMCTPEADYITGQVVVCGGGFTG